MNLKAGEQPQTVRAKKLVLVFATQRSGSTLLCQTLEKMGGLGRPGDYFSNTRATEGKNIDQLISVLEKKGRASPDEITVGVKMSVNYSMRVASQLCFDPKDPGEALNQISDWAQNTFESVGIVILKRRSMFDQAVSRTEARRTGLYHRQSDGTESIGNSRNLETDAKYLGYFLQAFSKILHENEQLNKISPLGRKVIEVFYEDLVSDPLTENKRIAEFFSQSGFPIKNLDVSPGTTKIVSEESRNKIKDRLYKMIFESRIE